MSPDVDPEDLVGAAVIAQRLGLSQSTVVHVWRQRYSDFPAPILQLPQAMIWSWKDIKRWAKATGRRSAARSPRLALVKANAARLIEIAAVHGASGVALCGSVAQGLDHDGSDIDFYVWEFDRGPNHKQSPNRRGMELIKAFKLLLEPYAVEVMNTPTGHEVDGRYEASMRQDCIDLASLII